MRVSAITPRARSTEGRLVSGYALFSDGKEWQFDCRKLDDIYFTIDSGIASQESVTNFDRIIAPPKRVAALRKKLYGIGEAPKPCAY